MAAFDYVALDKNGRRHKGVIEADSARQTRQILRERVLTPVTVYETSGRRNKTGESAAPRRFRSGRVGLRDISVITRQLATLVEAGLPVERALQALSRQNENPVVKSMLATVRAQVMEGNTLAASLGAFPQNFSELYCTSVHAGERTGHLDRVLTHLADFTESTYQARQKIFLALLYPAILSVVSLLIIIFLLAYIVPDMIRVFTGAGHALPLLTQGLIVVSHGVQSYGVLCLLAIAGMTFFIRRKLAQPDARAALDKRMLRWPLVGPLAFQYSASRFASTLGMLQESGVPLVQALEIAGSVLENRYIRTRVEEVAKNVREGINLSRAMEQSDVFPPVLVTMVGSGEASGQLGDMLARAGAIQQRDLENRIALMLGLFEPMVLLVMGGVVLLLVLAIILPILNLNQMVQ